MGKVFYPQCRAILQIVFDGFGDTAQESDVYVIPVIPKEATVHVNSYNQPDSYEVVCDANDLPIDPQLIRSGTVEVYMFEQQDLGDPRILNRQFAGVDDFANLTTRDSMDTLRISLNMSDKSQFTQANTPRVVGPIDQIEIDASNSGKWLTIQGQDYTALLSAQQWPPKPGTTIPKPLPVGERLDRWVRDRLAEADPSGTIGVLVEGVDPFQLPTVGKGEIANKRFGIPIETETTYWDAIYKVVTRYGYITFVRGLDVVITRPKNLESLSSKDIKRLAWGANLDQVKLARKFGKEKVPRIILNAYDPETRSRVVVEYPDNAQAGPVGSGIVTGKVKTSKTGKVNTTDEYQVIPVYGMTDRRILRNLAENLFQLIGKSERTIVANTRDLRDLEDVSLLYLNAGDAVEIEWMGLGDEARKLLSDSNATPEEKLQHLLHLGYGAKVATAIVNNYQKLVAIKRPMRLKAATYKFSADDGISIELEVQDFVMADGAREASNATPRKRSRPDRVQGKDASGKVIKGR